MGKIEKQKILDILDKYDKENITIATLGSHTSLHILNGAKEEGFKTAIVCEKGRDIPYRRFDVADEYIIVDKFKDIVNEDVQQKLRDMNSIVVPHGSFVAYAGLDRVEDDFNVPMFGNRDILRWEAERDLERQLLVENDIRIPYKYNSPDDIDRTVMVKFPGARGGRGYFVASSPEEFDKKIENMKSRNWLDDEDVENAHIEEYVTGCNYCIHYFYSALKDEVELMGIDSRYESSIDGLVRMPAKDQLDVNLDPSYVITGNHPVVMRESLLPQVFEIGDKLVKSASKLVSPGMNGPFCMQTLVNDDLEVIVFEISARTDGGTNTFMNGSSYSYLTYGEPMSMGRRVAREIKTAIKEGGIEKIIT
ncbi:5-formaminoimidazole-4-carboxamide-1-(beta)-D-ribofuranosyl 5'-monophosphate synthetase [Methanobrevibacter arboriphilus]|jgi:5-formaminoimidazole-4-carboxamide-1-(beta)-D-ribofuranosyl 5'-monophosphate synthetase|uniref:5-formaminoimidazole-4-carboxamide-1-(Beta)-D-ribofuranosyl 5'-monophosphate synthetase n=1 Tax=Methanobrevibacter arboriphilus TaxID=39441 RepID=A0ACA8R2E0_METAZ|nr:formate--phosphoribosylaminoimidazolecarboxamide ligase [Methanobrevibacter arboriphilus]MCC7561330.1 formate--phosphoribosylaminoimidazolecarboxamide ligase [Methanobrevibacter arboriphilus]BBL61783.1 5-formaminoimidazole-4-carboxamide-1-(beta)-D-ribofuranosyl 5'-monophosphate synthetase [Methanobrevibacter arboriphilus]GLI12847.1 5-formaminoimidazole-4-carboxamide-1-(beta)-D-ribofuranosyl 5'-monophosphate synthetase [Methanobrevibacter arboriphilus]